MSDEEIVKDIRASLVSLVKLNDSGDSFGAAMVKLAKLRLQGSAAKTAQANGRKGGRPRKQKELDALVSQKSLPGTSSGNGEALNDEGATAPAGQTFNQETRADAHAREDWDASATVRAQSLGGDAATREGAVDILTPQGDVRGLAPSPSDIQKRPGKSATGKSIRTQSEGGSERGADGLTHPVRLSPGAKDPEPKLRYGGAGNVLMTKTEMERLAAEFGDVRQITEELSDYLLLHPNKYRSHYAALRNWCRRRVREGRNPDGTKMTQGDRLARHFAMREKEILDGNEAEEG